tara:strand:+ start:250 stop:2106 length:1857 start_codon:yes stop_codon:yes gene_type:complete
MNEFLQQRISNLMGREPMPASPMMMAKGGEVFEIDDPATMEEASMAQEAVMADPNADLRGAIEQLMMAERTAEDPFEAKKAQQLAESAMIGSEAPLGPMALELSQAGRGGDTMLAHLTPGEVVLPLGMMDDEDFERAVEARFNQLDLNPEEYVAGLGIASLNPMTGLEEFGFFKKIAKGVKKVVKKVVRPVAQIAQFIPGPHAPLAALINRAGTVYDVAKGRASPLALASLGAPLPGGGKGIGSLSDIFQGGGRDFLGNVGKGISGLIRGGGADNVGRFGTLGDILGGVGDNLGVTDFGGGQGLRVPGFAGGFMKVSDMGSGSPTVAGQNPADIIENYLQQYPEQQGDIASLLTSGVSQSVIADALVRFGGPGPTQGGSTPEFIKRIGDAIGLGGASGLRDVYGQGGTGKSSGIGSLFENVGIRDIGAAGLAGVLAKLAYDEAKDRKGVPLTPSVVMNAAGRFNLENEIARRSGTAAPNPVEFGLLPRGTLPTLSGGRAPTQAQAQLEQRKATGMRYGGPVMAFAEGGNVDMANFKRMDGDINGPGTEVSDDIPAMLSDGEFVMTGRAVRGAGAFDMKNNNGIITLTPGNGEDRERGTKLMYEMMDLFKEFAAEPEAV